jgi:hypothetical protein
MALSEPQWFGGMAVSGSFMENHVLMAYNGFGVKGRQTASGIVTWDGKEILNRDGVLRPARGVELIRKRGHQFKPEELHEYFLGRNEIIRNVLKNWEKTTVYHFKLPDNVEVLLIFLSNQDDSMVVTINGENKVLRGNPGAEALIKMPSQGQQEGWCGNSNGNKVDDSTRFSLYSPFLGEERLSHRVQRLSSRDNLFIKAGLDKPVLMQTMGNSSAMGRHSAKGGQIPRLTNGDIPCHVDQLEKVKAACGHVKNEMIRQACISDACTTGQTEVAVLNADEVSVMMAMGKKQSRGQHGCKCD